MQEIQDACEEYYKWVDQVQAQPQTEENIHARGQRIAVLKSKFTSQVTRAIFWTWGINWAFVNRVNSDPYDNNIKELHILSIILSWTDNVQERLEIEEKMQVILNRIISTDKNSK